MTYRETCILLPCHSLEDFPMHHEGEAADGLLSAWTTLWHPALLATTRSAPTWHRSDSPPGDPSGMLILVPGVSENELPTGFVDRARREGARVIQGNVARDELLRQALEPVDDLARHMDADLAADFLALGYAYLQVELLTRQMRYSTNLDELHFNNQAVEGAKAAASGDVSAARDRLTACFDLLAQERDHYYAVDAYVLDVTLLAPTTLGSELCQQLQQPVPSNLMLTADLLSRMQSGAPESFAALQQGVKDSRVGLIGGELIEQRTPLLSCETVLQRLRDGLAAFEQSLGARPRVYGRRRFGLTVAHPQLLNRLGYVGVLHAVLGDGRYPEGSHLKIRWEGPDHQAIDAIGRAPLDAAKAGTYLSLASKLGETMDLDHVATVCLAHWPGHVCCWYHDLRRIARYGTMLGKFVTVDEYFRDTDYPGQTERFQADQYRSPYLQQALTRQEEDPISASVRYWQRRCRASALESLQSMIAVAGNRTCASAATLMAAIDADADRAADTSVDQQLAVESQRAVEQLANLVAHGEEGAENGYLVVNPSSHVRRALLDLPDLARVPTVEKPVYAATALDEHKYVVVDVPPMGFAWITPGGRETPSRREPRVLAEQNRLFNEFFEAHVNPTTGTLQSLFEYERRGNRLSQQLAVRTPRNGPAGKRQSNPYSVMAADEVCVTAATEVMGEITARGRLMDHRGNLLASFEQRYRVWRGSRVLQLDVQLDPQVELGDDPWSSYYCCRWAWADESALLWRGVNQLRERAEAKRFEAPNYIDIDDDDRHVTLFTRGLPFHRRTDLRMLDTLLIVKGERARSFQLGIGVGVRYPLHESIAQLVALPVIKGTAPPASGPATSWLFHVDSRNVLATAWEPVVEGGAVTGVCVRLLETLGRATRAKIRACRSLVSAVRRDFAGQNTGTCPMEDGVATVNLGASEWVEVALRWSKPASENGPT